MIPILDPATAKTSILRRAPLGDEDIPNSVLERIEATFGERLSPQEAVTRILRDIRTRGDAALRSWTEKLDGKAPDHLRVPGEDLQAALGAIPRAERAALELAAGRIEAFYKKQPLTSWITQETGGVLGQLIRPIRRVGLYVPGGTAPLPSSVLMSAVPAKVAGVQEIVLAVPPQHGTGKVAPIILAAAALVGVDEVYAIGGAQAIAALAYGTETIPAVDKIFGPGNLFVTLAKKQVFGAVGIDGLAGPTETVVIADESAKPAWVAADLLAQAEHDVLASAILLTPSKGLAEAVQVEVGKVPGRQRPLGMEREGRVSGRDLHGRVFVRSAGRLCGGAQPRHADQRHGALRLPAQRVGFRPHHQPGRPERIYGPRIVQVRSRHRSLRRSRSPCPFSGLARSTRLTLYQ